jgi:L-fuconolactonase
MRPTDRPGRETTRRRFLQQSAVLAAAATAGRFPICSLAADAVASADAAQPIIDTHQHLWDLDRFRLPWVKGNAQLGRSFLTADYLEATRGLNVVKAVYMEVAVDPAQHREEAEYIIELCRSDDHPTVAAVISGRPAEAGFAEYIRAYRDSPYIKGVRQVLHSGDAKRGLCLEESFVRSMKLLGEMGMCFDLCMRPAELSDGARLADLCPETRFVLDHCGNANVQWFSGPGADAEPTIQEREQWRRDLADLAKRKNVVCKISGIIARVTPGDWKPDDLAPIVNHCLDAFGPDRVMFASDWPVCTRGATLAEWVGALKQIVATRPRDEQQKLFHDNAERFYRLSS